MTSRAAWAAAPRAAAICGPVFNQFMQTAIEEYGGGSFEVPPGGRFYAIDRYSGQRLPDGEYGEHVVQELFREGEEPVFGLLVHRRWRLCHGLEPADVRPW